MSSAVHPSAIGSGAQPTRDTHDETAMERSHSAESQESTPQTAPGGEPYPKQIHAGKVGYGPNYRTNATFGEKIQGVKEEIEGTVLRKHDLVQHGKDLRTGELKKRERRQDLDSDSPFKEPEENTPSNAEEQPAPGDTHVDKASKEQAATVAPAGTHAGERQRAGKAADDVKHIG